MGNEADDDTRPPGRPELPPLITSSPAGLPLLPDVVEHAANPDCGICGGAAWVCENHPDRVWDGVSTHPSACGCGAGSPCTCTGMEHPPPRIGP